jgi:hypothetical protein
MGTRRFPEIHAELEDFAVRHARLTPVELEHWRRWAEVQAEILDHLTVALHEWTALLERHLTLSPDYKLAYPPEPIRDLLIESAEAWLLLAKLEARLVTAREALARDAFWASRRAGGISGRVTGSERKDGDPVSTTTYPEEGGGPGWTN